MKLSDPGCKIKLINPFTMQLIMKFTDLDRYGAKSLVYPSLIAKMHPHHFDGDPHQDAHIISWSPLLTGIASCPCNAVGVQRCIVMPGCPSAPIPFKALPSGWHQLGCCSKRCPLFKQSSVGFVPEWAWLIHPAFSTTTKTQRNFYLPLWKAKSKQLCLTGGFSLCGFFFVFCIYQHIFHPPSFFPNHLRNEKGAKCW